MGARVCHRLSLLLALGVWAAPRPAVAAPGGGCPASVVAAVQGLQDASTGPLVIRACPSPSVVVLRLGAAPHGPLDVEIGFGAPGFVTAGAFGLSPVLDAEWDDVDLQLRQSFDGLSSAIGARGAPLVRAMTGSAAPDLESVERLRGVLPATVARPAPVFPWALLIASLGLALGLRRSLSSRSPDASPVGPAELIALGVLALGLRLGYGLWGPLHVNGQGPLWLLGGWGRPELLSTYGLGYPRLMGWVAAHAPGAPDHAVFAWNALIGASVAPAAALLAAAWGHRRGAALLVGVAFACDPVGVLIGASESYHVAIGAAVLWAGVAIARAVPASDRAPRVVLWVSAALFLCQAITTHPLAWPLAGLVPIVAVAAGPWRPAARTVAAVAVLTALGLLASVDSLRVVWDQLAVARQSGPLAAVDATALPGFGFVIASLAGLGAAWSAGRRTFLLVVVAVPFIALDASTHRVFGQSALWSAAYRHLVWALPAVALVGVLPAAALDGARARWVPALAAVTLLGIGAWHRPDRTTEQLEYAWLRGQLAALPEGCRVAYVGRAERRILTLPEHLVPGWDCGTTAGLRVDGEGDITANLAPAGCRVYYRGSICATSMGGPVCAAAEAGATLLPIVSTAVAAQPSYSDLDYLVDPVPLTLYRVRPGP